MPSPVLRKLTPIVIVREIESLLPFYIGKLGFIQVAEVPHEDRLGFVMLIHGNLELMFQTESSAQADAGGRHIVASPVCIYMDCENLDDVIQAVQGAPVVVPRRTAPYGADEIFVLDPAGNTIGFAKPASE